MANTLTLSWPRQQAVVKPVLPAVYVNGARRRDLKVLSVDMLGPPTFGRATLLLQGDYPLPPDSRIEALGGLPPVGSAVTIRPSGRECRMEMPGVVTCHHAELGPSGEHLLADVEHALSGALCAAITERWHKQDASAVVVSSVSVCFNDGREGLASQSPVTLPQGSAHLFDSSATARRWTVADSLGYLLATAVPAGVQTPSPTELEALAGGIDLGRLDVTGMKVSEALSEVAARGGVALRASGQGLGLVFYRPGQGGRQASVRLQPPGEVLSPEQTNLWRGSVAFRRRPSRRAVLAIGAAKRYESTFSMQRGWDPSLQTSRWRDFVRSMSGNWPLVGDVYRKWVLNEHAWYSGEPWNLSVGNFSGISAEEFPLHRPRSFLPCLSCDPSGQSLGVVVETRHGQDQPWRRWRGPLWVSRDECAIYLGGDGLPGEFFQAVVAGQAELRVTATIEADSRLSVLLAGDAALPTKVIDASPAAGWSKVHSGSIFLAREDLGLPAERDDSVLLEALAQRDAELLQAATEGELVLGWVDTSYFVGDTLDLVKGRALELRSSGGTHPFVRSVHHDFGHGQCTTIRLEG